MKVQVTVTRDTTAYATIEVEAASLSSDDIAAAMTAELLGDADWRISDGNIIRATDVDIMDETIEVIEAGSTLTAPGPLDELADILADWPTMRALSAYGAAKATMRKERAREIVNHLRRGTPLPPVRES